LSTHILVFLVVAFLLAFPPISYMDSSSLHSCYIPCPSHPLWRDHSNCTWRRLQVMKLLIMQFSPTSRHFSCNEMSTRNLPGVNDGRRIGLTISPPSVSRLSTKWMWEPRRFTNL
jgi:hypothetical protein